MAASENEYGNDAVLPANVSGVEWTDTFTGGATGHWVAQNGQLLFGGISAHGTWTLRDDGAYDNGGPLSIEPGTVPYTGAAAHPAQDARNAGLARRCP